MAYWAPFQLREKQAIVLLHPIVCWLLGSSAGLLAREQLRRGASPWTSAYVLGVAAHALFVLSPLSLILALAYPAWAALGLAGPEGLSRDLLLGILGGSFLAALAGFWLQALLKRQPWTLAAAPLLLAVAGLVFVAVWFSAELSLSSMDEASAGPLLVTLVFSLPVMLAGWSFLLALFGLEGRKMRALNGQSQSKVPSHEPMGLADTRAKL